MDLERAKIQLEKSANELQERKMKIKILEMTTKEITLRKEKEEDERRREEELAESSARDQETIDG